MAKVNAPQSSRQTDPKFQTQSLRALGLSTPSNSLRRKTKRRSKSLAGDSRPMSPQSGLKTARHDRISRSSSKLGKQESTQNASVDSYFSTSAKYALDVLDVNDRLVREAPSASKETYARHPLDPPRAPRSGFEWVWFPEGYWAERERRDVSPKKRQLSIRWYNRIPSQTGNIPTIKGESNSTPAVVDTPMKIGESRSQEAKTPKNADDTASVAESRSSKRLLQSLQLMSPLYPHFTSPSGEPEGLYCKTRRRLRSGLIPKPRTTLDQATMRPPNRIDSPMTALLKDASGHLNDIEKDGADNDHIYRPTAPGSPQSIGCRPRRGFGLAPWHRRRSLESTYSASSSVRRLLMGKPPLATPDLDARSAYQYRTQDGKRFHRVEISDPNGPTYLPSEATRINTPPLYPATPNASGVGAHDRGFFFDLTLASDNSGEHTQHKKAISLKDLSSEEATPSPTLEWWENTHSRSITPKVARTPTEFRNTAFILNPPEHLPTSPLCPKNPLHGSGGIGVCVFHGRRRSRGLRVSKRVETDSSLGTGMRTGTTETASGTTRGSRTSYEDGQEVEGRRGFI